MSAPEEAPKDAAPPATTPTGACACGSITYNITGEVAHGDICFCLRCQAWSGGVALCVPIPASDITIHDPDDNIQKWNSSDWAYRVFCKKCGSSLYSVITAPGKMHMVHYVSAGSLKDWKDIVITKEWFVDRKPKAYDIVPVNSPDCKRYTEEETFALWASADSDKEAGSATTEEKTSGEPSAEEK
jgi:hypothetical protein